MASTRNAAGIEMQLLDSLIKLLFLMHTQYSIFESIPTQLFELFEKPTNTFQMI